tara:strand:- start:815 stop:1471 length:657 start_codon:yes stop_codon:yes gene_type:complete
MGSNLVINKEIEKYINDHSLQLNPIQKEIILHNEQLGDIKKMQIAVSQCHFLHLIIKISNIKKILEIGTFTGLSTLSMSLALPKNGKLIALDKNEKTSKVANKFFKKAKQKNKIKIITNKALASLNDLKNNNEKFDLVFIDADKENYKNYYDLSLDLIHTNGLIIIDNVLWYGEVVDINNKNKLASIIKKFNIYVNNDKRTENLILPLGDGLTICRKL